MRLEATVSQGWFHPAFSTRAGIGAFDRRGGFGGAFGDDGLGIGSLDNPTADFTLPGSGDSGGENLTGGSSDTALGIPDYNLNVAGPLGSEDSTSGPAPDTGSAPDTGFAPDTGPIIGGSSPTDFLPPGIPGATFPAPTLPPIAPKAPAPTAPAPKAPAPPTPADHTYFNGAIAGLTALLGAGATLGAKFLDVQRAQTDAQARGAVDEVQRLKGQLAQIANQRDATRQGGGAPRGASSGAGGARRYIPQGTAPQGGASYGAPSGASDQGAPGGASFIEQLKPAVPWILGGAVVLGGLALFSKRAA